MLRKLALAAALALSLPAQAIVFVNSTSFTYSQNFDALASSGGASLPWTNSSTLAGWYLGRQPAPGTPIATYGADGGTSTTGNFWSYGTASSSERALGGLGSGGSYFGSPAAGAIAGWIAVGFANTSGATLLQATIAFDGEQWRNGGNATAQTMVFEYGFGGSFTSVTSWIAPGTNFDWTSPVATATAAAVDGNAAGKVSNRGGTLNVSWNSGDTLWLRWTERNDTGNDHGLAIDNFNIAVSAVPEPASALLLAGGALLLGANVRRRRTAAPSRG